MGEETITLPEMMKKVGYKTAAIGSWHSEVEQMAEETARQMGFDYSGGEVDMNLPDCSIYEAMNFISSWVEDTADDDYRIFCFADDIKDIWKLVIQKSIKCFIHEFRN